MEMIRKFAGVIMVLLVILSLVVIRLSGNRFRPDAEKWAVASFDGSNIISPEGLKQLDGEKLVISLDEENDLPDAVTLKPADLILKENIRRIRKNEGPVILYSSSSSVTGGAWMVLSQIGIRKLYILSDKRDEVLKYKFRPNSLIRPELNGN